MSKPQLTFYVVRKDTGQVVVRDVRVAQASHLRIEGLRAARFAAWRWGTPCWAYATIGGRVLHVAREVHVLAPIAHGSRLWCPYPGCPCTTWRDGEYTPWGRNVSIPWPTVARHHAEEEHVLCGCNRFYTMEGWGKHRGQVRRTDRVTAHVEPLFCMRLRGGSRIGKP